MCSAVVKSGEVLLAPGACSRRYQATDRMSSLVRSSLVCVKTAAIEELFAAERTNCVLIFLLDDGKRVGAVVVRQMAKRGSDVIARHVLDV